ncbi:ketopantoate reductase family protein [Streptomyces odonnellii]|uniref:ketopantoate reductase family protein n=1 Tax=Streptomyces odonnellii TaxID=1417980 RepID=UPI000625A590|nr:ketopantoate reductase family protein [Streptomyces odonnellii]
MTSERILVVGAGATGGYFGARLAQAGRDVTFLLRPARAEHVRAHGLRLVTPGEDLTLRPAVVTADELDGPFRLVLLATRADAVTDVAGQIAPAVGPDTRILPVLNGVAHLDVLTGRFGTRAVLGGVAMIAAALRPDGTVTQLNPAASVTLGSLNGADATAVAGLLDVNGIDVSVSDRILAEMWRKWVFIVSITALTTLMNAPVGDIVAVPGGDGIARAIVAEAASVSAAAGQALGDDAIAFVEGAATQPGSPLTTSVFRDVAAGRAAEVEPMLGDFIDRARRSGTPTPYLDAATTRLRVYEHLRTARA